MGAFLRATILVLLLLTGSAVFASSANDGYFTITEPTKKADTSPAWQDPLHVVEEFISENEAALDVRKATNSLLDFLYHADRFGAVTEPYSRSKHFGTWIRDPRENSCYNTRTRVLIRDSSVPVTFRSSGCTVHAGHWEEPYTGRAYTQASDIQIDHFVPLKNAYISGAYKWNKTQRCLYANFMGSEFHLLPVYGRENSMKGDRTPEGYMPPNRAYQCQYLQQWLKVKLIWNLALSESEKDSILKLVQENHCDSAGLQINSRELAKFRQAIVDNLEMCR